MIANTFMFNEPGYKGTIEVSVSLRSGCVTQLNSRANITTWAHWPLTAGIKFYSIYITARLAGLYGLLVCVISIFVIYL